MEAFGVVVPRAPTYERMEESSRQRQKQLDATGYDEFRNFIDGVVLFRGTHRFKTGGPLPAVVENMRKVGHNPLSSVSPAGRRHPPRQRVCAS